MNVEDRFGYGIYFQKLSRLYCFFVKNLVLFHVLQYALTLFLFVLSSVVGPKIFILALAPALDSFIRSLETYFFYFSTVIGLKF